VFYSPFPFFTVALTKAQKRSIIDYWNKLMNPNELPQFSPDAREIYRLLKIGEFSFDVNDTKDVPHNLPVQKEVAKELTVGQDLKIASSKLRKTLSLYKGVLIYPAVFVGSFLIFYFSMNFPSIIASAQ